MTAPCGPSLADLTRAFVRIGCLSFGGPAGQIALMQREIVEQRGWIEQGAFLRALNLCHLLPGPEAQQLATWIGWRLHGVSGGLITGLLFVIPGALVMLALSLIYIAAAGLGWFAAIFLGIKSAVLAIVAQALIRIARRVLRNRFKLVLAGLAGAALMLGQVPFPVVIVAAGLGGAAIAHWRPAWLGTQHVPSSAPPITRRRELIAATVKTIALWLGIWAVPLIAVFAILGPDHVLWHVALFFSRLAIVTFGGAYAVLAYMAQAAVSGYGWLTPGEMADGLGLAETTPGPLIMVTQFVGFLAGFRHPGMLAPLTAGLLGAAITTWVTFAPCFLWILACAPWMERLEHAQRLQGALAAITAAVVGVIANLALWFAVHVVFAQIGPDGMPVWASLDWRPMLIGAGAAVMLFRFKFGVLSVLAASAAAALGLSFL